MAYLDGELPVAQATAAAEHLSDAGNARRWRRISRVCRGG